MSLNHVELNNMIINKKDDFYQLEFDKQAMHELKKECDAKTKKFDTPAERFKWLVENDYYYKELFEQYTMDQILDIHQMAYNYSFEHQSYMSMSKFYNSYSMRTNDKKLYLETLEDKNIIVALYYAQGDMNKAISNIVHLMNQDIQPATPAYMNAGRSRRGELISCFLMRVGDSLNQINHMLNSCAQLSKVGGGVSVNLSDLRASGDPIKGVMGAAKGIMAVAKLMEDTFSAWDQMGQRKGSGAAYYGIFGLDAKQLLYSKKFNADEKTRLKTLSIGFIIPNIFFKMVEEDRDFVTFSPYDVLKEYGTPMSEIDFDVMYETILNNPNVRKSKPESARSFMNEIARIQVESGYPYIMFQSNANKFHPLKKLGKVSMSNLCTEIFQLCEVSDIGDYSDPDTIRKDINCVLGSLNIYNTMKNKTIRESVETLSEILTGVIKLSHLKTSPGTTKANEEMHSMGIGAMNLHGYLATVGIPYESDEAIEFISVYTMMMNYYSLNYSNKVAIRENETFSGFEQSDYADGSYFDDYIITDYRPVSDKVKALFEGIDIPSPEDFINLKRSVMKYGIWHAYRLAIAPTQSSSYIQNATQSIMPITDQVEVRAYADSKTYYPMPFLSRNNHFLYKSAYLMDSYNVIDLVAAAQKHIDQGISCILFVDSNIATSEISNFYMYAEAKGLKSLYYTRSRDLDKEECQNCSV